MRWQPPAELPYMLPSEMLTQPEWLVLPHFGPLKTKRKQIAFLKVKSKALSGTNQVSAAEDFWSTIFVTRRDVFCLFDPLLARFGQSGRLNVHRSVSKKNIYPGWRMGETSAGICSFLKSFARQFLLNP